MSSHRRRAGGYTILEVMVVLSISTLLFASAVAAYTIQNRRTEFAESVNSFAQNIQDVLNDVETGFYPSDGSFSCSANASGGIPIINYSGSSQQGTNATCTFVGKAIQFGPQGTALASMDIYTIVGRAMVGGGTDPAVNINDADPVGLNSLVDRKSLIGRLIVSSVRSGGTNLSGFAMVSNSNSGTISSGLNARTRLAIIPGGLNQPGSTFLTQITGVQESDITTNGVDICVRENGANGRRALIQLATGESRIIVNTNIDQPC